MSTFSTPWHESEIARYLASKQGQASWRTQGEDTFFLTSQIWRNTGWNHTVTVQRPTGQTHPHRALLEITGGPANPYDLGRTAALAQRSGLTVITLFDVPNQPWQGMIEDDLIAHTLSQRFTTGETDWPLLFPMTQSVIAAMDAVVDLTGGEIREFIVTGASKRGWTTWLAAATQDPRILAAVPRVYDNLDLPAQVSRQIELWGQLSPMLDDYSRRALHELATTPEGKALAALVDPIQFLDRLQVPIVMVHGANDRFWAPDSTLLYWDRLPAGTQCLVYPNSGHGVGHSCLDSAPFSQLLRGLNGAFPLPDPEWTASPLGIGFCCSSRARSAQLWRARAPQNHVWESLWEPVGQERECLEAAWTLHAGSEPAAYLVQVTFDPIPGETCVLTSPVVLVGAD